MTYLLAVPLLLLAQSPPQAPPTVTQEVTPWLQITTSAGFAVLTWYLVTRQIPAMADRFLTALEAAQAAYATQEDKARKVEIDARNVYFAELRTDRQDCERRYSDLAERFDRLNETIRESRHEIANVAQQLAMRKAVEEARQAQPQPHANAPHTPRKGG